MDGVVTLSAPGSFMTVDGIRAAAAAGVPMLNVAAADDEPYATDASRIAEQLSGRGEVLILPGRAHGTELFFQHSEALSQAILDFLAAVTAD